MADCIGNTGAFYLATRRAYCNNFWAYSIANGATYEKRHLTLAAALYFLVLHPLLLTQSLSPSLSNILLCHIHENTVIIMTLLTSTESKYNCNKVGHCTECTQTQHGLLFGRQLGLLHNVPMLAIPYSRSIDIFPPTWVQTWAVLFSNDRHTCGINMVDKVSRQRTISYGSILVQKVLSQKTVTWVIPIIIHILATEMDP